MYNESVSYQDKKSILSFNEIVNSFENMYVGNDKIYYRQI